MQRCADAELVIFDCDGVVVDSELLATGVLREALGTLGVRLTLEEVVDRFLGRSPETIARSLWRDFHVVYDDAAQEAARVRLFDLFQTELKPVAGISSLLRALQTPYCLASSSQMDRIELALQATGLDGFFTGRIFSAAMVARGKPEPDLFLHAADAMGATPARCVVVEDSPAGIEAAQRAGMTVIGFTGGAHAQTQHHQAALAALKPEVMAASMREVARVLGVEEAT